MQHNVITPYFLPAPYFDSRCAWLLDDIMDDDVLYCTCCGLGSKVKLLLLLLLANVIKISEMNEWLDEISIKNKGHRLRVSIICVEE